jgi:ketosteroid isomerase-like protein
MKIALLLVSSLASLPVLLARAAPTPAPRQAATQLAEVRAELEAVSEAWDAARTSFDTAAFERMLAPDFWVQIGTEKMTRAEFIALVSTRRPEAQLARFESEILTLQKEGERWVAVVQEKLEVETRAPDGTTGKAYSLWVTKDSFRKDGASWTTLSSEAVGWQGWNGGELPPFDDWSE